MPPQAPAASFRSYPETPAQREARREKRDRQNINITLYVASLLLVAAAALFIGTSLPPTMRFAGVCTVTALFYGAGFVLHARVPRLRPAAVAFTGTGLAMVPVAGLALYNFALPDGPTAWLLTSLVGTVAYVAAAVRLESRVLVYLSLTFVASTAFSGVSVLGGALVWYFAALMGVAVVLTCLALGRPGWLPPVYVRPLMVLHPYVVPAVAVAATCVPLYLDKAEYALIIALCGIYFALMAVVQGPLGLRNFYLARAALTVAAAVAIWDLTGRGSDALLALCVLLAVQAFGLVLLTDRLATRFPEAAQRLQAPAGSGSDPGTGTGTGSARGRWPADASVTFVLQLAAAAAYGIAEATAGLFRSLTGQGSLQVDGPVPLWVPVLLALVTGMVLAARWPGRTEWPPAAALVLAGLASPSMGDWPFAVMLFLGAAYWAARAAFASGTFRGRLVLGARVALTLAVPVTVTAVVDHGPARAEAAAFALLIALVCQQLLTALLQRSGVKTVAPEATLGAFAGAGALVLIGLPFLETLPAHELTFVALLIQLTAALAIGLLLVPRPAADKDWSATVWEAMPLAMSLVTAAVAFRLVSQGAGNVVLILVVAYLAIIAVQLPLRQHRWAYWWLARAGATVLALTAFRQLHDEAGPVVIADEALRPATVLVTVLALQVGLPLLATARRRAPRWVLADAGAVVVMQVVATASLAQSMSTGWQATSAAVLTALGAAASGYFLRRETGAVWLAPFAFGSLLVFSDGNLLNVELILGIFAVYAAVMVVAEPERLRKGWYFVAARVLTAALALVLSYDISASPTVVSLTFAVVLAAQHAVRWAMRARLAEVPFQQAAVWITLAGQALLPLVYVAGRGSARLQAGEDDGGRWVVLLELLMLLASAVVARKFFGARGALYFTVYAALFGVLSLGPLFTFGGTHLAAAILSHTGTAVVLLTVALVAVAAGILRRRLNVGTEDSEHWLWLVTAGSFAVAGLVLAPLAEDWVTGAAVLVLSAVFFAASHVEGQPLLYPLAAVAALSGAMALAAESIPDQTGVWGNFLPWLAGAGSAAIVLYAVRLVRGTPLQSDPVRRWALAGAAFVAVILVAMAGVPHDETSWTAAAVLAAAVAIAYHEAPVSARRVVLEAGALVLTAAVQRAAIFVLDGPGRLNSRGFGDLPDPFWVVQWYVLLAAVLGGLRYFSGDRAAGRILVGAAALLLSFSGLGVVFGGTGAQQLWILVLFAALLVAGLIVGERLFVWWGAAGVAACILWAMRNYTFVLLALVAVGLIVFAVWRLNRTSTAAPEAGPNTGPNTGPNAGPGSGPNTGPGSGPEAGPGPSGTPGSGNPHAGDPHPGNHREPSGRH
ncbi:hypothetical protein [Pseudarthrobacter sp. BIM B-2242]|uniref:hypothetical protein n=1 Tax=Pseudarthrobacter sp. BIM B-2242 TaxID=2772401 RepID=UPI00168BCE94|nr:hypothetical protein [Pseudarthrobacter sp. BIM B-2242]QOD02443.1 hypothetical protein IDT60_13885 [Pseudarthrobacter sp. BIM B-2242]